MRANAQYRARVRYNDCGFRPTRQSQKRRTGKTRSADSLEKRARAAAANAPQLWPECLMLRARRMKKIAKASGAQLVHATTVGTGASVANAIPERIPARGLDRRETRRTSKNTDAPIRIRLNT